MWLRPSDTGTLLSHYHICHDISNANLGDSQKRPFAEFSNRRVTRSMTMDKFGRDQKKG